MQHPDPLRIMLIASTHYPTGGGLESYNHGLASALSALPDVRVSVCCDSLPADRHTFSYPVYPAGSFSYLTPLLRALNRRRAAAAERPHLLLGSMLHEGGYAAVQLGQRCGIPVIVQSQGSDVQRVPEIGYGACLQPRFRRRVDCALRAADRIVAVSRSNAQHLEALGADAAKIQTIVGGVACDTIAQTPRCDMRAELGLSDENFVIITVGRNAAVKRLDLLLETLRHLRDDLPTLRCICVGPERDLQKSVARYGLEDRVVLAGPVGRDPSQPLPPARLVNLYRSADLYVSTSYVEAFGLAALEAIAAGTPVIVGSRHGAADVLVKGLSGCALAEDTPELLADGIRDMHRRRTELADRRQAIAETARPFDWTVLARQFRELCITLLKGHPS